MDTNFLNSFFGHRAASLKMGSDILDFLYESEIQDYQDSNYKNIKDEITKTIPNNIKEVNEKLKALYPLQIRFYARITSYLSTIYQLDNHFMELFKKDNQDLSKETINQEIGQRKEEIAPYLFWRNKVFAHLADIMPRKEDSEELKKQVVYELGGYRFYFNHDECLSLGQGTDPKHFPEITIVLGHQLVKQHYKKWQETFQKYNPDIKI